MLNKSFPRSTIGAFLLGSAFVIASCAPAPVDKGSGPSTGTGGSTPSGTGGSMSGSTGGSMSGSTGGSMSGSTGGSMSGSTGGSMSGSTGGTGGMASAGTGGSQSSGTGGAGTVDMGSGMETAPAVSFKTDIAPTLQMKCANCHAMATPANGHAWLSANAMRGGGNNCNGRKRLDVLLSKIDPAMTPACGAKMPLPNGTAQDAAFATKVKNWIAGGAANN